MSHVTVAPPSIKTLADLRKRLGGIPLAPDRFHPAGTATEKDVVAAEKRENRSSRLCDIRSFIEHHPARPALQAAQGRITSK